MEEYIGILKIFAGNFPPKNWSFCHGQTLPISSNTALFSILGVTYGGDGRTTFKLPDLRGRVPVGAGTGPGIEAIQAGQLLGRSNTQLTTDNLPNHTHTVEVTNPGGVKIPVNTGAGDADTSDPSEGVIANVGGEFYATKATENAVYSGNAIPNSGIEIAVGNTGGNTPFTNMQPRLGVNYIICIYGLYPPRN